MMPAALIHALIHALSDDRQRALGAARKTRAPARPEAPHETTPATVRVRRPPGRLRVRRVHGCLP